MSRWFPKVDDISDDLVKEDKGLSSQPEKEPVTKLWTDSKQNTFKIKETKVAPNGDFSTEDRVREISLQRAKLWEYQEKLPEEKREISIESEDFTLQDRLRKIAISEARMELHAVPSRDPEEKEPKYETPFNQKGLNQENRFFDTLGQRDGQEPEMNRPLPASAVSRNAGVESIHIPDDKNTTAFKAVFRNLMGVPAQKQKSASEVKTYDVDGIVRSIVDSGYTKSWTAPDVQRPIKPDAVAFSVGKRALEAINAFKTMPELKTLSTRERDDLTLSIGRTMLNVSMTGPTASKTVSKITENGPLVSDSIRKKILATIDPEIMKKALGPEWIQISTKNNVVNTTVRNPTGSKAKIVPELVSLQDISKQGLLLGSKPLAPQIPERLAGPSASLKDEIWKDPYVD